MDIDRSNQYGTSNFYTFLKTIKRIFAFDNHEEVEHVCGSAPSGKANTTEPIVTSSYSYRSSELFSASQYLMSEEAWPSSSDVRLVVAL